MILQIKIFQFLKFHGGLYQTDFAIIKVQLKGSISGQFQEKSDNGPDRPGMRDNRDTIERGGLQIIPKCADSEKQITIGFPVGHAGIKNILHP
jgi:hypothetical protein